MSWSLRYLTIFLLLIFAIFTLNHSLLTCSLMARADATKRTKTMMSEIICIWRIIWKYFWDYLEYLLELNNQIYDLLLNYIIIFPFEKIQRKLMIENDTAPREHCLSRARESLNWPKSEEKKSLSISGGVFEHGRSF
jgi:hypothetical protein